MSLIENDPRIILESFGLQYRVVGVHYCLLNQSGTIVRRNVTKAQMSAYAEQLIASAKESGVWM